MNRYSEAQTYVGTNEASGYFQCDLLKLEGCRPESNVLEIGCGCLHAAMPLVQYLNVGHYVGIEPNRWLIESVPQGVKDVMQKRSATFLYRSDFDASSVELEFDFIFAHSILSHCSHLQADEFLHNSEKVLAKNGKIIASLRLSEGNAWGSPGHPWGEDSMDCDWQYPGVSWFRLETISRKAYRCGLLAMLRPKYTQRLVTIRPQEFHDWMIFCRP